MRPLLLLLWFIAKQQLSAVALPIHRISSRSHRFKNVSVSASGTVLGLKVAFRCCHTPKIGVLNSGTSTKSFELFGSEHNVNDPGEYRGDEGESSAEKEKINITDIVEGQNYALHQIEHRAKEKGAIALSQRLAQEIVSSASGLAKRAAEQATDRTVERLVERTGERVVERTGESISEKVVERGLARTVKQAGEKVSERFGEGVFGKLIDKLLGRYGEHVVERAGERRLMEATGEHLVKRIGDSAVKRGAEKAVEHVADQTILRAGERMGERTMERVSENAVERTLKKAAERGLERMGEAAVERAGERAVERTGERAVKRVSEHASEQALVKVAERSSATVADRGFLSLDRLAIRLGRSLLIVLPALGGVFALYLLRSDLKRFKEEWSKRDLAYLLFAGAGLADGFDSLLHFWIVYALLTKISHHQFVVAEEGSLACAIISTLCAVVGELVSHHVERRRTQAQDNASSDIL